MTDNSIGNLQRLSAREVFEHEAHDFTTWLEENIDALGEAIGVPLTAPEREKSTGDFSADLFAEDEDGRRTIVENQLEQTDHKHLGQVLTYLTVLDAEIAIWVTADARPEHVSAVSWLNENATGADFFLVKVEGVRVDDSRAAPLFTRIVGPSPETRAAGETKKEFAERERLRKEFFSELLPVSNRETPLFSNISPQKGSSISTSAGPGFSYAYGVTQHQSRFRLWLNPGDTQAENDAALDVLREHEHELEAKIDAPVDWIQDDYQRRLVAATIDGGYRDSSQWDRVHRKLTEIMIAFESVFDSHLDEARRAAKQKATEERDVEADGQVASVN